MADPNPFDQFHPDEAPPQENPFDQFHPQETQAAAPNPFDQFHQQPETSEGIRPEGPQRTWGEEIGRDIRTGLRAVIPTTAGIVGGLAAGSYRRRCGLAFGGPGFGTTAGGVVRASPVARPRATPRKKSRTNSQTRSGLTAKRSAKPMPQNPSLGSTVAEFAPAAISLNTGSLATKLSQRVLTGGIMGAVDLGTQAATKGVSNIDPTEAAVAAGTGALLPGVRPWAGRASGAVTEAVQGALGRGGGNGNPPGGAATTPAAKAQAQTPDALADAQQVDRANDLTKVSQGTAEENVPAPGAKAPDGTAVTTADNEVAPAGNKGFQAVGSDRRLREGLVRPKVRASPAHPAQRSICWIRPKRACPPAWRTLSAGNRGKSPMHKLKKRHHRLLSRRHKLLSKVHRKASKYHKRLARKT